VTGGMSPETRKLWKDRYRFVNKHGIRVGFAVVTGSDAFSLVKEASKDGVKRHAKRYMGTILIDGGLTCISGGIPLLTNATKIVKYSKACHSVCAASWRAAHNIAEFPLIALDFALFGEYVPSCGDSDYDLYSKTTNVISEFTN
jgi:hypothetical protein